MDKNTKFPVKSVWHCCKCLKHGKGHRVKVAWTNAAQFLTAPDTWPMKIMLIISLQYTSVTEIIVCIIFLMYIATIQHSNYKRQESKTCNLQFIFLTNLWPWNSQGHQTYNDNVDPKSKEGYNHNKFEWPWFDGMREKANFLFFFKQGNNYVKYLL